MSNPLCNSLIAQWTNPIRNWTRDTLVCPSGNSIERQRIYKESILANKNGNGNIVNGSLSKKMHYSKIATRPPPPGKTYANNSNPNINNLPRVGNTLIDCSNNS